MANPSLEKHPDLDQWIAIGKDGRVAVQTGKVDIGQRISTALALIAAEELDVDYGQIDVKRAETGIAPNEGFTSGSNSMEESGATVQLAAATARQHMLGLAAVALGVDAEALKVDDGLIIARGTNRTTSYRELMGGKRFGIGIDEGARVKAPAEYSQIGRPVMARNMEKLVAGSVIFVHDMSLPGMLHARVIRPPHYFARLKSLDEDSCRRTSDAGNRIIWDGSFLAVAGEDEYAVIKAAERLKTAADWDDGGGLEPQDIFERLHTNERLSLPVIDGKPVEQPVAALPDPPANAEITLEAGYGRPYHMHGAIAPSAALAHLDGKRMTVWSHSQGIYFLRAAMADALGMEEDNLRVIHAPGSGCYGHNGADDAALDAALIARAIPSKPVLLKWTREDEHAWEPYGAGMAMDLRASLAGDGSVLAWSQETHSDTHVQRPRPGPNRLAAARLLASRHLSEALELPLPQPNMAAHGGIHRNLDPLYDFPERRLVKHLVRGMPLRTSSFRTLGAYANVFAIESFMDELAEASGQNPVAFRLRHLGDPRAIAVLEEAAKRMQGWGAELGPGFGRGIAFARYKNAKTYAAVGCELEVTGAAE